MATLLLIIDPQVDFCDPVHGKLSVSGAEADMRRLAAMLDRTGDKIDEIVVTLDSHHPVHIAHPIYWRSPSGEPPAPFTLISASDVDNGLWRTARIEDADRARAYVHALDAGGKHALCIWPPHCLIGSHGHAVAPALFDSIVKWEGGFRVARYFEKGSNLLTEHYSALRAEVPDAGDPGTQLNKPLLAAIDAADLVVVAGEAGSHCVACTLADVAETLGTKAVEKIVLLTDAVSPVPGFESLLDAMLRDLTGAGMRLSTTCELTL